MILHFLLLYFSVVLLNITKPEKAYQQKNGYAPIQYALCRIPNPPTPIFSHQSFFFRHTYSNTNERLNLTISKKKLKL
jgi:hypothetical protein